MPARRKAQPSRSRAAAQRRKAPAKAAPRTAKKPAAKTKAPPKAASPAEDFLFDSLRTSPIGAVISQPDGHVLYANKAAAAFFGVKPEHVVGARTVAFFADPEQRDKHVARLQKQGVVERAELRMKTAAGVEKVCLISAGTIQFRGKPAILSWVEDESEWRRKQQMLRSTSLQMELVHRIAGIANRSVNFYDALRQGAAEIANFLNWPIRLVYRLAHGQQDLLEIATFSFAPEVAGQQVQLKSLLLGGTYAKDDDLPGRVLAEGQTLWVGDVASDPLLARFAANATQLIGSALAVPVTADGRVVAVLEFLNPRKIAPDELLLLTLTRIGAELGRVHSRDQTTVALQEARAEAESSSRAKASFLAAMSHEVRTPMNGVVGMVDLLLQTRLDEDQRTMLQTVRESGQALIKVINDILDFSKIDAGRLEIESAEFSMLKVVEEATASLAPIAIEKSLRLVAFVDPRIPERVLGDAVRVRQILSNLGGNAVKFSHAGEIVIKAEFVEPAPDGRLKIRFSVKDQGIGISAEAQRRLFEEFSQADTSTTRKFGGTGLGLAICHRLSRLMDGEIGLASEVGRGTEFYCTLPLAAAANVPPARQNDLAGLRVIVASASQALREACRVYLAHWDASVTLVERLGDCLPAYQNMRSQGQAVDVIVVPELEDARQLAVLQQAFTDKRLAPSPRLVVSRDPHRPSAFAPQRDVTYVDVNPLRRAGLITAVAIASGRASPEPYEVPASHTISNLVAPNVDEALTNNQLILVAEDHEANREVLRRQLNRLGYACEIANDGLAALAMWRAKKYALLLSDCHMPEMDGFGLTAEIRKTEADSGRHIPIVAITANVLQGEAERCLAAGMDDFLPKPAEMVALKGVLEKWIGRPIGARPAPTHAKAPRPALAEAVLDLTIMSQTFGEINDEARDMLKLFVDSIRPLIGKFETEFGESRLESACETIHKARGAVANAGGKELASIMGRVEAALIARDREVASHESADIRSAWDRLLEAIAAA